MKFVYLLNVENTDYYKIGVSKKHPNSKRIGQIQTGNSGKIVLVKFHQSKRAFLVETTLHNKLKHKKYIEEDFKNLSGEWFKLTVNDVLTFNEKCLEIEKQFDFLEESSTLYYGKKMK